MQDFCVGLFNDLEKIAKALLGVDIKGKDIMRSLTDDQRATLKNMHKEFCSAVRDMEEEFQHASDAIRALEERISHI